jgi:anaerobic selenocysteine-containing dehydrogenase
MNDQPQRTTFFGACPHDCPDTCAMIYEVENGKLVEVRGNKEHPMTRGGLCVKLKDFHDHHANPDRLMFPLRRTGPKGSKQFARISWEEAIGEIGRRWREIIATYGSQAIMPYSYLGNMGLVQGINSGDPFFNRDLGLQLDLDQPASLAVRARGAEEGRQGRGDRQLPVAHGQGC